MKKLKFWFEVQTQFRERLLVISTLLIVIGYGWWNFYAEPAIKSVQETRARIDATQSRFVALQQVLRQVQAELRGDQNENKKKNIALLQQQLERLDAQLRARTLELIAPQQMVNLFDGLLSQKYGLEVVSLKRNKVEPVLEVQPHEDGTVDVPEVYRHYLTIEFEGEFDQILAYLKQLEGLQWRLLWESLEVKTLEYPRISLQIQISTLSTQKFWIGV